MAREKSVWLVGLYDVMPCRERSAECRWSANLCEARLGFLTLTGLFGQTSSLRFLTCEVLNTRPGL